MSIEDLNPANSVASIAKSVSTGLDELFTSDEERLRAQRLLQESLQKPHILQAMTNLEEAKNPSIFVSGWRPALGWLCVVLLAYSWIGRDLIVIFFDFIPSHFITDFKADPTIRERLPELDEGAIMSLVLALLGLGATRTYEKVKNVARTRWKDAPEQSLNLTSKDKPEEEDRTDFTKRELRQAFHNIDDEFGDEG